MKRIRIILLTMASLLISHAAQAADPTPPPISSTTSSGYSEPDALPEPEVRIFRDQRGEVEEYSVNGRTYMVRITPTSGPAYYLVDRDGDGSLESRSFSPADPGMLIPQWLLFSW